MLEDRSASVLRTDVTSSYLICLEDMSSRSLQNVGIFIPN